MTCRELLDELAAIRAFSLDRPIRVGIDLVGVELRQALGGRSTFGSELGETLGAELGQILALHCPRAMTFGGAHA
jgi:hypothetical protein